RHIIYVKSTEKMRPAALFFIFLEIYVRFRGKLLASGPGRGIVNPGRGASARALGGIDEPRAFALPENVSARVASGAKIRSEVAARRPARLV
ncbi:MAG: hypothetical protein KGS61_12820, partial [Verrucomicrobia bacterium]|nr:hypothetical protein [Verrucomicrobiota bacterium]